MDILHYIDIDECAQGNSRCSQGCRNTPGDFICTCNEGYQTHHSDPTFCVGLLLTSYDLTMLICICLGFINLDIDECVESNGGCQHDCSNNIGSYQCWCHSGYVLRTDQHGCEGD